MKDTYTYQIGKNLYINLTNRCTNRCTFCVRDGKETYAGYALWLKGAEPAAEQIIAQIGDPTKYDEIVFCGFGEPTYRLDAMLKIAEYVHREGGKTRLNTNGHGNALNERNIAPELVGKIDGINISLNEPDEGGYNATCLPLIPDAFYEMLNFAKCCRESGLNCWFSVVDIIGEDKVAKCKKIAEEIGIPLRVRTFIP